MKTEKNKTSLPKNRTFLGLICMLIAIAVTFVLAPTVNRMTENTVTVVRLSADVKRGSKISDNQLESVKILTSSKPGNILTNKSDVVDRYAASDLFAGDYLTKDKLSNEGNTAEDLLSSLDGTKVAMSFTIDSFAAGLSGKLCNGDIVSILVTDKEKHETSIPAELTYVKVITTTTAGGTDEDCVVKNEDGTYELPSTITVLVNTTQAKLLSKYESEAVMHTALVYRGDEETANRFLQKQEEYFK